jgi:hypothetical protein
MMYPELPAPIALGMCGALAGLFGGGFSQCFPVWVGTATGCGLGCLICIVSVFRPEPNVSRDLPVATPTSVAPVVIQNIYITYEISGVGKEVLHPVDANEDK